MYGALAGGDVDAREEAEVGGELDGQHAALGGGLGEVDADERLFDFFLARGVEVLLDDEVGTLGEGSGDAFGEEVGLSAGGPGAQTDCAARKTETGKAGDARGAIDLAERAGRVAVIEHVVDDLGGGRADLDGADPFIFGQTDGDEEVAVDVGAAGGDFVGLGEAHDEVGLAELPAGGELGEARGELGVAFGRALLDPVGEEGDLGIGEAALVAVLDVGGLGVPAACSAWRLRRRSACRAWRFRSSW